MELTIAAVALLFSLIAIGFLIWILLRLNKIDQAQTIFFQGKDAESLENIVLQNQQKLQKLDQDIEDLFSISNQLHDSANRSLTKLGVIRFNAFGEKGHKDCFAIALTNNKNDGLIISTLNTESGPRIFLKKIVQGKSDVQLTQEEDAALKMAK